MPRRPAHAGLTPETRNVTKYIIVILMNAHAPGSRIRGFTLVELLVVIAIIAVLATLLAPAVGGALARGRQAACLSNLRQLGVTFLSYAGDHGAFPAVWTGDRGRWMDLIKPYVVKNCEVYRCPADRQRIPLSWDPQIVQSYGVNSFRFGGADACLWYGVRPAAIPRLSMVVILADCTPGKYYCGGGNAFREPVPDVDYRHPGPGFSAVFGDAHAEPRTKTTKEEWDVSQ